MAPVTPVTLVTLVEMPSPPITMNPAVPSVPSPPATPRHKSIVFSTPQYAYSSHDSPGHAMSAPPTPGCARIAYASPEHALSEPPIESASLGSNWPHWVCEGYQNLLKLHDGEEMEGSGHWKEAMGDWVTLERALGFKNPQGTVSSVSFAFGTYTV